MFRRHRRHLVYLLATTARSLTCKDECACDDNCRSNRVDLSQPIQTHSCDRRSRFQRSNRSVVVAAADNTHHRRNTRLAMVDNHRIHNKEANHRFPSSQTHS
jgi:hypothetical protein